MTSDTITALASHVADIAETIVDDDVTVISATMGEMGDGSRRHYALVTTYDATNNLEQEVRVTSPRRGNSPAWATIYTEWVTEVRIGDQWVALSTV